MIVLTVEARRCRDFQTLCISAPLRFYSYPPYSKPQYSHTSTASPNLQLMPKQPYLRTKEMAIMVIQRNDNQIIITLPANIDLEGVQRLINYLMYKEATKDSKAKQEDVDKLAREANRQWWEENKHRFLPE